MGSCPAREIQRLSSRSAGAVGHNGPQGVQYGDGHAADLYGITVAAAYSGTMPVTLRPLRAAAAAVPVLLLALAQLLLGAALPPNAYSLPTPEGPHATGLSVTAGQPFISGDRIGAEKAVGPSLTAPAAPAKPRPGQAPPMDLISITPVALTPGDTLQVTVKVTNTSSQPLPALVLELRTRTSRVTERHTVKGWRAQTQPDRHGAPVATSTPAPTLAPGASARMAVSVPADQLGYSTEPYLWGTRRISITLASEGQALHSLRTFVVWHPQGVTQKIRSSVLLPIAAPDPGAVLSDRNGFAESVRSGQLAQLKTVAQRPDVDWWLDPSLLDPPLVEAPADGTPAPEQPNPSSPPAEQPTDQATEPAADPSASAPTTDPSADPSGTPSADPSSSPSASPAPTDDPSVAPRMVPDPVAASFARELSEAVGQRTVIATPYARADLVSLQAAKRTDLAARAQSASQKVWKPTGITPRATALQVTGPEADARALQSAAATSANALVVPSSSLVRNLDSTVTPSSTALLTSGKKRIPVLAPDPELSHRFTELSTGQDPELTAQELLALTATIASEHRSTPRHLLISPELGTQVNADTVNATLDAFAKAPWIQHAPTAALLDAAEQGHWSTRISEGSAQPYAIGEITAERAHPSRIDGAGNAEHLDRAKAPALLPSQNLDAIEATTQDLDALRSAMAEDSALATPQRHLLVATSRQWRGRPEAMNAHQKAAAQAAHELHEAIRVVPASGYNLIADSAGVPITVENHLDTAVTVTPVVSSSRPIVHVSPLKPLTVPPQGKVDLTVPVEAIAAGTVELSMHVKGPDGAVLSGPVQAPLTVNPAWENWTTLVIVVLMTLLVLVGVMRARRVGSDTRAPGVKLPEDPVELARSGRSLPVACPDADDSSDPAAPQHGSDPSPTAAPDVPARKDPS